MVFATTTFRHVIAVDAVWEYKFIESLVWLLQYLKSSGYFTQLAANLSRWEWNIEFIIWCLPPMIKSIFYSFMIADSCNSLGARSVLPMGVASEAIVGLYLFEYRLKVSLTVIIIFYLHKKFLLLIFLSGVRSALPMGVAPRLWWGACSQL
jgi:hypothetical protein